MSRLFSSLVASVVILASGLVQGVWTGRWSSPAEYQDRVARVSRIPLVVGDWQGEEKVLDRRTLEAAEIDGYVMRRYKNRRDDRTVMALVVCGRPGPISVHTPEICYAGSGYEPSGPATKHRFESLTTTHPAQFWSLELGKQDGVLPDHLRLLYSWNAGSGWVAARNPRVDFAGTPGLYKLYVVRQMTGDAGWEKDNTAIEFARDFLSALEQSLFAKP